MNKIRRVDSVAHAAFAIALFWSMPAAAQVPLSRDHGGAWNTLATGAIVEIVDQAKAERRLHHLGAKFRRDTERDNVVAVDRDARRINNALHRIAVDEWLIRKNLCQELVPYPNPVRMDGPTCAAIAQYHRPPPGP